MCRTWLAAPPSCPKCPLKSCSWRPLNRITPQLLLQTGFKLKGSHKQQRCTVPALQTLMNLSIQCKLSLPILPQSTFRVTQNTHAGSKPRHLPKCTCVLVQGFNQTLTHHLTLILIMLVYGINLAPAQHSSLASTDKNLPFHHAEMNYSWSNYSPQ